MPFVGLEGTLMRKRFDEMFAALMLAAAIASVLLAFWSLITFVR